MIDPRKIWSSTQLPTLPSAAMKLLDLSRSRNAELRDVVEVIQTDPALSAKILKATNSSFFGVRSEIRGVDHAVSLLGTTIATSLALSFSLTEQAMSRGAMAPHYRNYWMQSVVQGVAAEMLCRESGEKSPSEFFLCGLLMDIGRLAMLKTIPDDYRAVLEQAAESDQPLFDLERELLGVDHVEVGVKLMEQWKMADALTEAVRQHHAPLDALQQQQSTAQFTLCKATATAATVGDYFCANAKGPALRQLRTLAGAFYQFHSNQQLQGFLEKVNQQIEKIGGVFSLDASTLGDPVELMAQANEQLAQLALRQQLATTQAEQRQKEMEEEKRRLEERNLELQKQALHDPLTKVYNRQFFDENLTCEANRARRQAMPIGLIFVDVDHFKKFNDTYGHQFGDLVLQRVAACLGDTLRNSDVLARYGGEEFVILVHQPTEKGLQKLAERLRQRVEAEEFTHAQGPVHVTASFGAAIAIPRRQDAEIGTCLVASADEALYEAKHNGRNQVRMRVLINERDRKLLQLVGQRRFSRWLVNQQLLDIPTVSKALLQCPAEPLKLGELAQRQKLLEPEQVRRILEEQQQKDSRFGETSLQLGLLTQDQLVYLLALQQENPRALAVALVRMGAMSPQSISETLERYLREVAPPQPTAAAPV